MQTVPKDLEAILICKPKTPPPPRAAVNYIIATSVEYVTMRGIHMQMDISRRFSTHFGLTKTRMQIKEWMVRLALKAVVRKAN